MILNSTTVVLVKLVGGEMLLANVLEARVGAKESPLGRMAILLKDVGTVVTQRHPQKPAEVVYTLIAWQAPETYIALDKVIGLGVASDIGQDYHRQVFGTVQVATPTEVAAMQRPTPGKPVIVEVP